MDSAYPLLVSMATGSENGFLQRTGDCCVYSELPGVVDKKDGTQRFPTPACSTFCDCLSACLVIPISEWNDQTFQQFKDNVWFKKVTGHETLDAATRKIVETYDDCRDLEYYITKDMVYIPVTNFDNLQHTEMVTFDISIKTPIVGATMIYRKLLHTSRPTIGKNHRDLVPLTDYQKETFSVKSELDGNIVLKTNFFHCVKDFLIILKNKEQDEEPVSSIRLELNNSCRGYTIPGTFSRHVIPRILYKNYIEHESPVYVYPLQLSPTDSLGTVNCRRIEKINLVLHVEAGEYEIDVIARSHDFAKVCTVESGKPFLNSIFH